ncbi:MAG: hypothetical protein NTW86_23690 [Candidatus Sumerlaeota bacterium]|nr:hypothetical protein [Candidatus Sumerlaeota bacterium]
MRRNVMLLAFALCAVRLALAEQVPWEQQLRDMGYWIYHESNLNVINGLDLSREQAQSLRAWAREVQALAPPAPTGQTVYHTALDLPRTTYVELESMLLQGQTVPDEFKNRIALARAQEAKAIRASLAGKSGPARAGQCTECHHEPDWSQLDAPGEPPASLKTPASMRREMIAHYLGLLGTRGFLRVQKLGPQVEKTLNEYQKLTMGGFSCCLVPPHDLAEPSRIGQAPYSEEMMKLLDKIREVPAGLWPIVKATLISRLVEGQKMAKPGMDAAQEAAFRKQLSDTLDKSRTMSDLEFEVEKKELAALLKDKPAQPSDKTGGMFKQAFFLLLPGSVPAYDALLARMDAKKSEHVALAK